MLANLSTLLIICKNTLEQQQMKKRGKVCCFECEYLHNVLHYCTIGNWRNKPLKSTYSGIFWLSWIFFKWFYYISSDFLWKEGKKFHFLFIHSFVCRNSIQWTRSFIFIQFPFFWFFVLFQMLESFLKFLIHFRWVPQEALPKHYKTWKPLPVLGRHLSISHYFKSSTWKIRVINKKLII